MRQKQIYYNKTKEKAPRKKKLIIEQKNKKYFLIYNLYFNISHFL